jgi:hypothetical protein
MSVTQEANAVENFHNWICELLINNQQLRIKESATAA